MPLKQRSGSKSETTIGMPKRYSPKYGSSALVLTLLSPLNLAAHIVMEHISLTSQTKVISIFIPMETKSK